MNAHEYMRLYLIESSQRAIPPQYDISLESDAEFLSIMSSRKPQALAASRMESSKIGEIPIPEERIRKIMLYQMPSYDLRVQIIFTNCVLRSVDGSLDMGNTIYFGPNYAELRNLHVMDQGKNTAKQLFANFLYLYDETGIKSIRLSAVDIGTYAWAKYGFTPDVGTLKLLHEELREVVGYNDEFVPSSPLDHIAVLASITIPRSKVMRFKAAMKKCDVWFGVEAGEDPKQRKYWGKDGSFLLGKYYLLSHSMLNALSWEGVLDLTDSNSRNILERYIGYSSRKPNL